MPYRSTLQGHVRWGCGLGRTVGYMGRLVLTTSRLFSNGITLSWNSSPPFGSVSIQIHTVLFFIRPDMFGLDLSGRYRIGRDNRSPSNEHSSSDHGHGNLRDHQVHFGIQHCIAGVSFISGQVTYGSEQGTPKAWLPFAPFITGHDGFNHNVPNFCRGLNVLLD